MKKMYKVLIADDEYWTREDIKHIINWEEMGLQIVGEAEDGSHAIQLIAETKPHILITDIRMPFMDGIKLLEEINKNNYKIQTIVISGYDEFDYVRGAMILGASDYLLKPIKKMDLINVLIKVVEKVDRSLVEQINEIDTRSKLTQAASIIIDSTLSQAIYNGVMDNTELFVKLKSFGLTFNYANYILAAVKINDYRFIVSQYFKDDMHLLVYGIKNIVNEIFNGKGHLVFHNLNSMNEIIIVLDSAADSEQSHLFHKLLNNLRCFIDGEIDIGISSIMNNLKNIKKAYERSKISLDNKPFRKSGIIMRYDNVFKDNIKKGIDFDKEKIFVYSLDSCNEKEMLKTFNMIVFENRAPERITLGEVRHKVSRLMSIINKKVSEFGINFDETCAEELSEVQNTIENCDYDGLNSAMQNLLKNIKNFTALEKSSKNIRAVVMDIKEYIDKNFFFDLSLSSLADIFHIESTYLSRAFKQETGENITNYISKIRMEKAVELIKNQKIKISEAAALVGYEDYAYFNRIFKKYTGKSPREFFLDISK